MPEALLLEKSEMKLRMQEPREQRKVSRLEQRHGEGAEACRTGKCDQELGNIRPATGRRAALKSLPSIPVSKRPSPCLFLSFAFLGRPRLGPATEVVRATLATSSDRS